MIKAIVFDFYGVWVQEKFSKQLSKVLETDPDYRQEFQELLQKYFFGFIDASYLVGNLRLRGGLKDIPENAFELAEADLPRELIDLTHEIQSHFVKVGILAGLGKAEYRLLQELDSRNKLFEFIGGPVAYGTPLFSKETFIKASNDIGEPPQNWLLVTAKDTYAAHAATYGINTLKFETLPKLTQDIRNLITS